MSYIVSVSLTEIERRIKVNDGEYNAQFEYAVSIGFFLFVYFFSYAAVSLGMYIDMLLFISKKFVHFVCSLGFSFWKKKKCTPWYITHTCLLVYTCI